MEEKHVTNIRLVTATITTCHYYFWPDKKAHTIDLLLEICPRDNHIFLYSWLIKCSLNIHEWQLILIYALWSICETLYLYEYSKVFLVGVHVRTHMNIRLAHVLIDWLRFTSHGHGDVKLIMWAHVRHEIELTQHEMMTSHYTYDS